MKKSSILITALFLFSSFALAPATADAQHPARGTVKKSTTSSQRTTTTRTHRTRSHSTRNHSHHRPHHRRHTTHRSGVHVHVGWPYTHRVHYGYHYPRTYYPHTYRHTTVVYDRSPEVVVVEAEPRFVMPGLECPIRTDEERAGLQQWCATSRGTKHGLYRRWFDNGVLATEGEYDYDLKSGVWVEYHANGAIREEGAFKDGARVGTWVTWGSDGQELVVVDY